MKRLNILLIFIITIIGGCSLPRTSDTPIIDAVVEESPILVSTTISEWPITMRTVRHDGHEYIILDYGRSGTFIHSSVCPEHTTYNPRFTEVTLK